MPFVRISLKGNRSEKERLSISNCVHRALVTAIGIPEGDRFQVITEHNADLVYDPDYLNIHRTDGIIMNVDVAPISVSHVFNDLHHIVFKRVKD